jgi:hypothetical protein
MTPRTLSFALALALATPALAQAPAATSPAASAGPADNASRSALRAARAQARQACADDYLKLCPGKDRQEGRACMLQNQDKLSQTCKDAVAKAPRAKSPS